MDEFGKWEVMMSSIRKAAHILNIPFEEEDYPEYLNWKAGADMHKRIWAQVYAKRRR